MRVAVAFVAAAALAALVSARCPNSCSGHGDCGAYDKCTCWANWQGYDCAERTCEFDVAWAVDQRQNAHYYAECSGKGLCDRTTGLCNCFPGYTGSACKRSVCPNDCSGHGKCRLVAELKNANKAQSLTNTLVLEGAGEVGSAFTYAKWDGDKIQACVCDGDYYGADCSQRYCPKGDDPLTTCTAAAFGNTINTPAPPLPGMQTQVQTLKLTSTIGGSTNLIGGTGNNFYAVAGAVNSNKWRGDLVLHYTDNTGEVWTTSAIKNIFAGTQAAAALLLQSGLQAIPNYKIPVVSVASGTLSTYSASASSSVSWTFTFGNERNSGENQLLTCDPLPLGCTTVGCSPWYAQPALYIVSAVTGSSSALPGTGVVAAGGSFITADSIFDNSALPSNVDQATFTLNVARASNPTLSIPNTYATYWVSWNFAGATPSTSYNAVCAAGGPYACYNYVPTGATNAAANNPSSAAGKNSGLSAFNGVGYNRVPIGYGLYVDLDDSWAGLSATGSAAVTVKVSTVRCTVVETTPADANYESLECSGRGTCDSTTGLCSCYEGHFGDHCGLQTILV